MACACSTITSPRTSKAEPLRVDFYQLGPGVQPDGVIAALAAKLIAGSERLLVMHGEAAELARIDRQLWDQGPLSFLAHGIAGEGEDKVQPILLSLTSDAPNGARNLLIADGEWREVALGFERAFFLFGDETIEAARLAWKLLSGREGVERHYWAQEDGSWAKKA